jgi:predicted peptidase
MLASKLLAATWLIAATTQLIPQEFISANPSTAATALPSPAELSKARSAFQPDAFTASSSIHLPYRLLSPDAPKPKASYPLILILHGSGAIGTDNQSQLGTLALNWAQPDLRHRFPAYVLVPQFPSRTAGYKISTVDGLLASTSNPPLSAALDLVEHLANTYPIDRTRIYIIGFSMGASAGWHALLRRPSLFAAAVLLSGIPPERSTAAQLAGTPILITHGNTDPENPFAPDRVMFAALQRNQPTKARFREYDNLPHTYPPDILIPTQAGDWWRIWLFAQHR